MAEAVLLNSFRQRLAAHMAGTDTLLPIAYMAFGDGGHEYTHTTNDDGTIECTLTVKTASASQTELNNEVLRKEVVSVYQEDEYSVTAKGEVENDELVGTQLSEAALCDTAGNVLAIKNFSPKVKENNELYDISIQLRF